MLPSHLVRMLCFLLIPVIKITRKNGHYTAFNTLMCVIQQNYTPLKKNAPKADTPQFQPSPVNDLKILVYCPQIKDLM